MNPLRLLILIVLIYLLYRLLLGSRKNRPERHDMDLDSIKHDILIEDPVCHTYVPKSQAVSLDQGEKIYYFCSRKCRDAFRSKEEESS